MSTPSKPNCNPLKRSRPLLPSCSQNVFDDSQSITVHALSPHFDSTLKSPSRKKRKDPNIENRTPERESTRSQGSSRRSATPDVRYEPPSEKFTPPRNVVLQVPSAKSSRTRLSTPVRSSKVSTERKVVVKLERSMSPFPLPPIDLTRPPPPPSPTDDPLLLLETPITAKPSEDMIDDTIGDNIFDDTTSNAKDIFDSDDQSEEVGEAEGEFTGRFKFYKTPVKDDPPSSLTKRRRESWGRPISPHPRKIDQSWGDSDQEDSDSSPLDSHLIFGLNASQRDRPCVVEQAECHMVVDGHSISEDEYVLPGVVEVSSDDPRAAARAAAILKLHHSYIIDGIATKGPHVYQSPSAKYDRSVPLESSQAPDVSMSASHQYRSPSVSYASLPDVDNYQTGKDWTKAHWKLLDTCFTDERFAVAQALGKVDVMADVDDIQLDCVVERFITQCSDLGWNRTMLLRRVQALSNRQRLGRGAPRSIPTPTYGNGPTESAASVPLTLLAPRYAYLRNELRSTKVPKSPARSLVVSGKFKEPVRSQKHSAIPFPAPPAPEPQPEDQNRPSPGAKTVLGYLGSFLGRYSPKPKFISSTKSFPSLPAPPTMRQVREPISTPVKAPVSKERLPKELVQLNEVSPRMTKQFERLQPAKDVVNLNHIEPPPSVRPRVQSNPLLRNSRGSVKDLIKCFEEADRGARANARAASTHPLRRAVSVSDLSARSSWNL